MSEPKEIAVEEMDGWLTSAYNGLNYSSIENADIRRAIRKRIEQPAVTVEQICRWARFIWRSIPPGSVDVSRVNETQDNFIEQLKYILTELGIEVSKEVEPPCQT